MKSKSDSAPQARKDAGGRKPRSAWPRDVMVAAAKAIPSHAKRRPAPILAWGEATGHSHRIADGKTAEVYEADANGVGFLRVTADAALLVHDEHKAITLPRGTYRFWQQREYYPKEIRIVRD